MSLDEIRSKFMNDRFATGAAGAEITRAGDGYAECIMLLKDIHKNAMGNVMGGAIFTLCDFAFAVASNGVDNNVVSLSSSITYLSPAKGALLTAKAERVKEGRSTCFYIVNVYDDTKRHIASMSVNGYKRQETNI